MLPVIAIRLVAWVRATRARRRLAWVAALTSALVMVPGFIGAVAMAAAGGGHDDTPVTAGLAWMNVRDSSGVPLSQYMFATDRGSILNPGVTAAALVIDVEFAGYSLIVTTAIWLIGYALSYQWLSMFSSALQGVADALAEQIATPLLLGVSSAMGAVFVGYFIARGLHSKATRQVVTMLAVAVVGPLFLAEPLADVLSPDGLLAQGRDVGVAVAAGLNGNSTDNPRRLVSTMQESLADNFARRPLQVWNFGHVVDQRPRCGTAWSGATLTGKNSNIANAMEICGDRSAYASAQDPSAGKIATGLLLLMTSAILLLFAAYLAVKVMRAALDSIYHCFMAIFGFAAGGFVYGPTQTFLIRNLVDGVVAAGRMAAYTIFLGVYVLFLGNLFAQAKGQTMAIFVIGTLVEIIAIAQLRRLSASISRGNEWIANRISVGIQQFGGSGGGGGGARALGMGPGGSSHSMSSGLVAGLAALSTVNNSPATAWLWAKTPNPLNPYSRGRRTKELMDIELAQERWPYQFQERHQHTRDAWRLTAQAYADRVGYDVTHPMGIAHAINGLVRVGARNGDIIGTLMDLNAEPMDVNRALTMRTLQDNKIGPNVHDYLPRLKAESGLQVANERHGTVESQSARSQAHVIANTFYNNTPRPTGPVDRGFVADVHQALGAGMSLDQAISRDRWEAADTNTLRQVGLDLADNVRQSVGRYAVDPQMGYLRNAEDHVSRSREFDDITDGLRGNPWSGKNA